MRFTSNDASTPPQDGGLDTWLFNNKDYFSEWSTMCLIRGIDQPQIEMSNLNTTTMVELDSPLTGISGKLYYNNNSNEKEYLKCYQITIYESSAGIANGTVFKS